MSQVGTNFFVVEPQVQFQAISWKVLYMACTGTESCIIIVSFPP
jgi:hypothetical protein